MQLITISQKPEGFKRKDLVNELAALMGTESKYLGVPSCAYQIGNIKVLKDDSIEVADEVTKDEKVALMTALGGLNLYSEQYAWLRESVENEEEKAERVVLPKGEENEPHEGDSGSEEEALDAVIVQIPDIGFTEIAWNNLLNLLEAKGSLISKALDIDDVNPTREDGVISFPWVKPEITSEKVKAAAALACAICKMAKEQKRINPKEKAVANEKYAFRCFLLRLGFIGKDPEIKAIRKQLLKNLEGSSAFKTPKAKEENADATAEQTNA